MLGSLGLESPVLLIESGMSASTDIAINKNTDAVAPDISEPDEAFMVEFGEGVNASQKATHTVTIPGQLTERSAPVVSIKATQIGKSTRTVTRVGGEVDLFATFTHPLKRSRDASFAYEWSTSADLAISPDSANASFDPVPLPEGVYTVNANVTVTAPDDDGQEQSATGQASLTFRVIARPALDCSIASVTRTKDTDGDGKTVCEEGEGDTDGDGIADYLDSDKLPGNVLQSGDDRAPLETEPGLKLKLSTSAFDGGRATASVDKSSVPTNTDAKVKELVDFTVEGVEKGKSVAVVLPQSNPIPDGAVYQKLIGGTWRKFSEDVDNAIASTQGAKNKCPGPSDSTYSDGLTAKHWCVRLAIQDGGPNDDDGEENGSVDDPGGVGVPISDNVEPIAVDDAVSIRVDSQVTLEVLGNDTDENGDLLSVIAAEADLGTVSFEATLIDYTPPFGFVGTDTVSYAVSDGQGGTATAIVQVEIFVNRAPVAIDDTATVESGNSVTINVLANDSDPDEDSLTIISGIADNGSVDLSDGQDLTYTPSEGFTGTDSIVYSVQDTFGDSASATVTVTVSSPAPVTPPATPRRSSGGGSLGWIMLALMLIVIQRRLSLKPRRLLASALVRASVPWR